MKRSPARLAVLLAALGVCVFAGSPAYAERVPVTTPDGRLAILADAPNFRLWQLRRPGHSQMMSYVIETGRAKKLIVIDGGDTVDAVQLRNFIVGKRLRGGPEVLAWFVTHQHPDHVGALTEILTNPTLQNVTVKAVYGSFYSREELEGDPHERRYAPAVETLANAMQNRGVAYREVFAGGVIYIDGVKIEIVSARLPVYDYQNYGNFLNDSSVVMRVSDGARSVLFTGDLGRVGAERVRTGPFAHLLPATYVQMAHHGKYGANGDFYRAVRPKYCIWPTPFSTFVDTSTRNCRNAPGGCPVPNPACDVADNEDYSACRTRRDVEEADMCGGPTERHFLTFSWPDGVADPCFFEEIPRPGQKIPPNPICKIN